MIQRKTPHDGETVTLLRDEHLDYIARPSDFPAEKVDWLNLREGKTDNVVQVHKGLKLEVDNVWLGGVGIRNDRKLLLKYIEIVFGIILGTVDTQAEYARRKAVCKAETVVGIDDVFSLDILYVGTDAQGE